MRLPRLTTCLLAGFLALQGLAHLAGASAAFKAASDGAQLEYLGGAWAVSDPATLRLFAVVWVLLAIGFVVVGYLTWVRRPNWPRALVAVASLSAALLVVGLWSSAIGLVIDLVLIAVGIRFGAHDEQPEDAT